MKTYKELFKQIDTLIFDVDGVLTNGIVTVYPDGQLLRHMNIKDGYALKEAVNCGLRVCIISGGKNEGVRKRLNNLGITDIYLDAQNKIEAFNNLVKKYNLNPNNILYMGDDLPDLPVMQHVALPCCPNDAAFEVQQVAKYISDKKGGEGCARDVIEQLLRVKNKWNTK